MRYADPSACLAMLYACRKISDCEDSKLGKAHREHEEVSARGFFDQFRLGSFNNSGYVKIRKMKQSYRLAQYKIIESEAICGGNVMLTLRRLTAENALYWGIFCFWSPTVKSASLVT